MPGMFDLPSINIWQGFLLTWMFQGFLSPIDFRQAIEGLKEDPKYKEWKIFSLFFMLPIYILIILKIWNWLMPDIFGLPNLNFWNTFGLYIFCQLLLNKFELMTNDRQSSQT